MSFRFPMRAYSISDQSQSSEKFSDETQSSKTPQSTAVTSIYQTNIAGFWRKVTILWNRNIMNHSLGITIDSLNGEIHSSCKIDLKPWHFWSKKGYKSFEVDQTLVDVYWDLRSAKFSGSPEPLSDYYVALVSDEEVVLLLGDYKKKSYKRTKARPALVDAVLFYKRENVFSKKSFSTRANFDGRKKDSDIVIESSTAGPKDPEMWVSVDGIVLMHVKNLQWKFRGNQTVVVNKQPVQVFWDVHDWLFAGGGPGAGHGLFIFKPGGVGESESDKEGSSRDYDSDDSNGSRYFSTVSYSTAPEFCLYLYAWKIE